MLNQEWIASREIKTLKEHARKATVRMESRRRILRLWLLTLLFFPPLSSSVQECTAVYFWVAEEISPRWLEQGVRGNNHISVPEMNVVEDLWVNSIFSFKDQANWLEIGWYAWMDREGEKHWSIFGRKTVGGEYAELFDLPAATEHDYQFSLTKASDTEWEFSVVDLDSGTQLHDQWYYAPLDEGYAVAQQERHNRCLNQETHWWDLGYWTGTNWHPWPGMIIHYDNDPGYEITKNTHNEFWVERIEPVNQP